MPAGPLIRDSIRILGLFFFAVIFMSASAQDMPEEEPEPLERFEVEVLIFAYRDVIASGEQLRPPPEPLPTMELLQPADGIQEITPPPIERLSMEPPPVIQVQQLLNTQLALQDEQRRIDRVDAYDLLLHAGFSQEGVAEKWALPVSVRILGAPTKLGGEITLHRGRFLHVTLDLSLDTNTDIPALSQPYRLQQARRLRSGEVHYFDHPALGVVLTVRPEPEPEPEPEPIDVIPTGMDDSTTGQPG